MAAVLRRGFDEALRAAAPDLHAQVPDSAWREGWWVHTQPAGSGDNVVKYLARYVGRTAISDERIVAADDEAVTFRYREENGPAAFARVRRPRRAVPERGKRRRTGQAGQGWAPLAAAHRRSRRTPGKNTKRIRPRSS